MTTTEYNFAITRIKELQNPEIQPLGLQLGWELNELMKQVNDYENIHHPEILIKAESSEWHAFDKAVPSYEWN